MCQPVAYDSEDMSSYSESEAAVSSGDEFDREEELRGYNNRAIDFTLHTILEESCEDSEPDSTAFSSMRSAGIAAGGVGIGGRSSGQCIFGLLFSVKDRPRSRHSRIVSRSGGSGRKIPGLLFYCIVTD